MVIREGEKVLNLATFNLELANCQRQKQAALIDLENAKGKLHAIDGAIQALEALIEQCSEIEFKPADSESNESINNKTGEEPNG